MGNVARLAAEENKKNEDIARTDQGVLEQAIELLSRVTPYHVLKVSSKPI